MSNSTSRILYCSGLNHKVYLKHELWPITLEKSIFSCSGTSTRSFISGNTKLLQNLNTYKLLPISFELHNNKRFRPLFTIPHP
jgi:hypothetical protein